MTKTTWIPLVLLLAVLVLPGAASAQYFGQDYSVTGTYDKNVFAVGRNVEFGAEITGDLIAFGRELDISGRLSGDILSAGRDISVRGTLGGDIRAAAEDLNVTATADGDLMAAGRRILIAPEARIGGRVWMAGEILRLAGSVGGDVHAGGRDIVVTGSVGGNADLTGETIRIGSTAVIEGDLTYRSEQEAIIEPGAQIRGDTIFIRSDRPERMVGGVFAAASAFSLTILLGLFLLGVVQILVLPTGTRSAVHAMRESPGRTVLVGLAFLFAVPAAVAFAAIIVVGIPVAIVLAALYIAGLFHAFITSAHAIGSIGARRLLGRDTDSSFWPRVAALAAGLVFLVLVGLIPILGGLVMVAALSFGLGAIARAVFGMSRGLAGEAGAVSGM